ncbi:flagellum-specific ATP synthase [Fictibacillus macauensis ZFHKF-1]|uniref:Flagellum-specific ATP synthase n=1 Tax=Fictibacillus macauensis ZFHKF-1 TaxID=1196324 RepID=I8UE55_9BACL|nr:flagellar protein export ATPase FliI [Fictibacillus macauensis]EIT85083.1 flagellum-specific ATP synthase [Fictibacillus macauensis ZFHKF-1]
MNVPALKTIIQKSNSYKYYGRVTKVVGLTIESSGPRASIGDLCYIHLGDNHQKKVSAEVVGFHEDRVLLMPFAPIKEMAVGSLVEATGQSVSIGVGPALIGQVIDALGKPLDGVSLKGLVNVPTDQEPPNPLSRPRIKEVMSVGVRSIDSALTVGKGQRMGIFAGSGVGKSTLLGMIARNSMADVNVIALIGERGREVMDFIERDLGEEGLKKSVVIVATSDQPALMRLKGAMTATAIAEYFRDCGMNVMLMMDSVTRFAMAQREIGLAVGEPPTTKGYTPSVFALLPKLLERSGMSEHGSITAFYTVLVDGDDMNEPIADSVRGILDGHIVLDRSLAHKGQFPAIALLKSVSRVMNDLIDATHKEAAASLRKLLATYLEAEDLITIGAYKKGSSASVDHAIKQHPKIISFLQQSVDEPADFYETLHRLLQEFGGETSS